MKAVVLVGGEGTRLRPLTFTTPKQMLPIVEQPMLERVLGHLRRHGVDEAVLSLGYLPDAFIRAYPDGVAAGVRLAYAVEPEPLDTAGAVRFAADELGVEATFVVVNGDVLTDADISALIEFHRRRGAEGTIHLSPVPDPSAFGVVPTDERGQVTAFVEKPPRESAPTNLINAGTYVLEPSVLSRIPKGRRTSIERVTFPAMVRDGSLFAREDDAYWLDTGTPEAYLKAHRDLLDGCRGTPPSPEATRYGRAAWTSGKPTVHGTVEGASFLGDRVVVAQEARVVRSVIGAGCVVSPGVLVADSVVLGSSRLEESSSVVGSIVGARATIGEGCGLRPVSVVGDDALVPPGSVLEGVRIPA